MSDLLTPPFETKIALVVRDDLQAWQRLNVVAFLATGIAARYPMLVGEDYRDADGQIYLAMLGIPMLVFEAGAEDLRRCRTRAVERDVPAAVYTHDMFATGHDAANRATVAVLAGVDLDLVGVGMHGPTKVLDKILKGTHLHP